ncbi:High-copy suppressor of rspA [Variovorax sp. SRS16]|uniref:DHA2 family efflux MFS transporter permease subunit n=1 Tax=Variovorax sp. SRS16 TaxID=282217 RepID=UPI001317ECFD|nr:DHA2 family efflux MFS transporter permease subunit [Variovorax sp. SRS16]VTU24542.1 High-copy suppressor of rspA [Variovorax sp. SRS16]
MSDDASSKASTGLLWVVAAAFFMQTLDTTIVNTALPSMAHSLDVNPLAMQPVIVAYTLTMAMLTPASGWLADRFGTRATYFGSILMFALGSVACASAQSLPQLIAARVLQGIGGSMLLPIGRLAMLRSATGEQYVATIATVTIAGQLGPLLGPTLGGWLVQAVSWHAIFLINVPIGLVGLWAVRRYVPVQRLAQLPRLDFVGFALLSTCMVAFSLALDVPARTHRAAWSGGLLALSAIAVGFYLLHARRRPAPLFRLGLFREPNFSVGLIGNMVSRIGISALPFLLPLLLQLQLGYSPLQSGMMMIPVALGGIAIKPLISGLLRRFGYDSFLLYNTLIVGAAMISLALIKPGWPLWLQIVQLAVFGGAASMQFAAMNSITLKGLSNEDAGSGNSLFTMVQMLALGLGATIGGGLVSLLSDHLASTALAFRYTFVAVGIITLLSSVVFRWLDDVEFKGGSPAPSRSTA